ncbi:hypothetical protein ACV34I_29950, partial [Pseudomonas aeruginosa]
PAHRQRIPQPFGGERRPVLESGYVAVLASQPLHRLQLCLDVWPALLRTAQRHAVLDGLHGRVRKRLRR